MSPDLMRKGTALRRRAATHILLVVIFGALLLPQAGCKAKGEPDRADASIRVMSFNLRRSNLKDTATGNGWFMRRAGVVRAIEGFDPDLLGTQEGFEDQVDYVEGKMKGFAMHGVGRDDGKREGEYTAIYYRKSRFGKVDGGHRWLSSKPDKPGSRTWRSPFSRMMSWVRLQDRKTGRTLLVVNTHWDNLSSTSRKRSAEMVRDLVKQRRADAVIVTGDFNCEPGSSPYNQLLLGAGLVDTFEAAASDTDRRDPGTYHEFDGDDDGRRIDWIVVSSALIPTSAGIIRDKARGDRYPSDHFPVTAVVEWADRSAGN